VSLHLFLPKSPSDAQLQTAARDAGLYVAVDKFGGYYLQILNPPPPAESAGFIDLDPHLVLARVSRKEIIDYLRDNRDGRRLLSPAEVLGPIVAMRDDNEDEAAVVKDAKAIPAALGISLVPPEVH
jgi:hypothetical protein